MENIIFLVTLVGSGVPSGKSIIGYTDDDNIDIIALLIKNKYNLVLGKPLMNKNSYQNGIHLEYTTNRDDVDVHVDIIYKIE